MPLADWLNEHEALAWWLAAGSVAMFAAGIVLVPLLVARMPADYFTRKEPPPESFRAAHPVIRYAARFLKNVLGAALLLAGILMLALPGQGVLSILLGLSLLGFPGKRRLELWILRRPAVLAAVQWLRAKAGRRSLELP